MKKELEKKLFEEFEFLRPDNPNPSFISDLMVFGIMCDDGWFDILYEALVKIKKHIEENPEIKFKAEEIKEKYGELRFYYYGGDEYIEKVIDELEKKSRKTCEICGKPGELRDRAGWYKTLCEKHAELWLKGDI